MKVAIAGYGIEGKSSYDYFSRQGHQVTILDERTTIPDLPPGAEVVLGELAFSNLSQYDMVIRTPSLAPGKLEGVKKIWSSTNEFFAKCPARIIGVTGTKGKGTTSSLIASILNKARKTVHLVGNIGTPALDELEKITPNDVVVFELSSFQLWDLEKSPHIAVVLMIEPDHMDIHTSFDEYVKAKQHIVQFQNNNDITVFNAANVYSSAIAAQSSAMKIPIPSEHTVYVRDEYFWYGAQKICSVSSLKLPGAHNQDNACAAIAAAWPLTHDTQAIEAGLADFPGLPHRLKFVREVDGVRYYDDSIATTAGSAIAALKAFSGPKIIILGGSSKGAADFEDIASQANKTGVKKALLIGERAGIIQEVLGKHNVPFENLGAKVTMQSIVQRASELATPGDSVILSPACASFGMFKNYADRGDQFIAAVNDL